MQWLFAKLSVAIFFVGIIPIVTLVLLEEPPLRIASAEHRGRQHIDYEGFNEARAHDTSLNEERRGIEFTTMHLSNKLDPAWSSLVNEKSSKRRSRQMLLHNILPRQKALSHVENEITLLTHGSVGRLDRILNQIDRWQGPVSVALYVSTAEDVSRFRTFVAEKNSTQLENSNFHVLLEYSTSTLPLEYPHNKLRNLLLRELDTNYFLALDADFVTEKDCYNKLKSLITQNVQVRGALHDRVFLVLPAFEPKWEDGGSSYNDIPESKAEIISLVRNHTIVPFQIERFKEGHGPTDFQKWLQNDTDLIYDVQYTEGFEPFILGRINAQLPLYWERFRGFHKNKLSWFLESNCLGFRFAVLRDAFVYHVGVSGVYVESNREIPEEKLRLWREFMRHIRSRYVKKCRYPYDLY